MHYVDTVAQKTICTTTEHAVMHFEHVTDVNRMHTEQML